MDFLVEQTYFELWQKHFDATLAPKEWLAASGALAGLPVGGFYGRISDGDAMSVWD